MSNGFHYRDLDRESNYDSDDEEDVHASGDGCGSHSPITEPVQSKEERDNEELHAKRHDISNTFIYHCNNCGDNFASHTELRRMPRCKNCGTDAHRVKLPDNVLFTGAAGLVALFCCPDCNHHWMNRHSSSSHCKECQNKNLGPPAIKPCMYGVGWIITRFLGSVADAPRFSGPPPSHAAPAYAYDSRRPINGHPPPPPFLAPPPPTMPPKDRERDRDLRDMMYDRFVDDIRARPDKYDLDFFTKNANRLSAFLPVQDVTAAASFWLCTTQPDIDKKTARDFVATKMQNDQPMPEQTYFNCPFCNNNTKLSDSFRRLCDGGKESFLHSIRGCNNKDCVMHTTCHAHAVSL